jgi:tRNA A-37 threonylcarbamoyl transferase component Bud32
MHGIVFFLLHRFAENTLGDDGWAQLLDEAGMPNRSYSPAKIQPDKDLASLVSAASRLTARTVPDLLERFGQYIGPELLSLYPRLINPEWKTLDIVANTEDVVHSVVRADHPGADPPHLRAQRISEDEVQLVYSSPRQMCALAKGMVQGLAQHFDETIEISEDACMHKGDPFCSLTFTKTADCSVLDEGDASEADTFLNLASPTAQTVVGYSPVPLTTKDADDLLATRERWLGTYRILRHLGKGGMGEVYLAEDPALQRKVAIKLMNPQIAMNDLMRERFVHEARSMAALNHEHIVPIFHIGHHERSPYIVMPRLKGMDFGKWIRSGNTVSPLQLLRIVKQTASALAFAHNANLIHRDVKPSNIWLEAPKGHVKLMDFGLCRSMDEIRSLTAPGVVVGTPMYVAPECVNGEAEPRSDLYSLGVVMYEALTGVQPFAGKTLTETVSKIATLVPKPPRASNASVPQALSDLVMQMLEKDAARRPASAQELGQRTRTLSDELRHVRIAVSKS